jgi:hypothetical protein
MTRPRLFWGILLILAGGIFLAGTFGLFKMDLIWKIFWPLVIVFIGLWVILGSVLHKNRPIETQTFSTPLEGVKSARIVIHHGAGKFEIASSGNPDVLVEGTCAGGVEQQYKVIDGQAKVELQPRGQEFWDSSFPWHSQGLEWKLGLSPKVPMEIFLKTGASESFVDLSNLVVTNLSLETGASSTRVFLPEKIEHIKVKVSAGAASISIKVPESLAARIHMHNGISSRKIDTNRFVQNGSVYESPNFESAAHKAEITFETGVSSIEIV